LRSRGETCRCIRCREIRRETVDVAALALHDTVYETWGTREHFLSFERDDGRLAGFLRLSLPVGDEPHPLPELSGCAMIREIHVYGPVVPLGTGSSGEPQHAGLGVALLAAARTRARAAGFHRLAVISAVGTQTYYERHGFVVDGLYMTTALADEPATGSS
jgi:elongator complex protein 3